MSTSIQIGSVTIHQSSNGLYAYDDAWEILGNKPEAEPSKALKEDIGDRKKWIAFKLSGRLGGVRRIDGRLYTTRKKDIERYLMLNCASYQLVVIRALIEFQKAKTISELELAKENAAKSLVAVQWKSSNWMEA